MFSDVLKELRAKTGISQLKLAKAIGVSNGNIGDWERGRSKPGYDAIVALSRFFGISSDSLLELSNLDDLILDDPISETCTFPDVLKNLRSKRNISQAKLAEEIGVSPGNVGNWESGLSKPGYDALIKLSKYFNVSADFLLELSNPCNPSSENCTFTRTSRNPATIGEGADTSKSSVFFRINTLIRKQGLSLSKVEKECGLGNGTIKRWESQSPRLDKLVSVARFLDVSLDFLVFGISHPTSSREPDLNMLKQEQGLDGELVALSEMESDLITMMRLLPAAQKKDLFDYVYFRYVQHVEQEKGSIYSTYFDDDAERNEGESGSSIA